MKRRRASKANARVAVSGGARVRGPRPRLRPDTRGSAAILFLGQSYVLDLASPCHSRPRSVRPQEPLDGPGTETRSPWRPVSGERPRDFFIAPHAAVAPRLAPPIQAPARARSRRTHAPIILPSPDPPNPPLRYLPRPRELIRSVRACKTAAEERALVAKESASIRASLKDAQSHYSHRNVAKLMYLHMLGYPTHWGQMECVTLIARASFPEKRIGYLGLMVLLDERQEVTMMVTNTIKNDLAHRYVYFNSRIYEQLD